MRARQHVNPLSLAFETYRGPKHEWTCPIEIEIGCADAQFLFERAKIEPERTFVGLEIREQLVDEVNEKANSLEVPVVGVFCNANHHLSSIFDEASVDRVYLNFPDPWFKKKHHKRRMINRELLEQIAIVAKPGADIFFQSDVWDVALETMELFEQQAELFSNRAGAWSFWKKGNPFGAKSWRETNAEETGLSVWRLLLERRS